MTDWLNEITIYPELEDWQEKQNEIFNSRKEIDFELLCEYDLICCNSIEVVQTRLKDSASRIWDSASKKLNSRPLSLKLSAGINKNGQKQDNVDANDEEEHRIAETFDLSMMVPDGRERLSDHRVLDGKKQQFGQILRENEENRLIEQELMNVDPNRATNTANIIDVYIFLIFIELLC